MAKWSCNIYSAYCAVFQFIPPLIYSFTGAQELLLLPPYCKRTNGHRAMPISMSTAHNHVTFKPIQNEYKDV